MMQDNSDGSHMKQQPKAYLSKDYTLLTGATGLVGRYLMRDLLLRGHRLAVVVRRRKKESPRCRVESILGSIESELDLTLPRPVVLEGDVCEANLGLSMEDLQWIEVHCNRIIHSAAILDFHGPSRDGEPWLTNVGGTRNVLAMCEQVSLDEFHYLSTAYVCGNRSDLVREDELDVGQQFRNDYERSKFEAEKLVRDADFLEQLTVYRPAVISGDSQTGFTNTYHGLHLYLRLISMMVPMTEPDENGVRHTQMRLPMSGDEPRNIVPVDWVSRVFCEIFENEEAHGRTFHIVPQEPTTPRHVVESCYRYFNSNGVEYVGDGQFAVNQDNKFESKFLEGVSKYQAYDHTDPRFGDANIKQFASHFSCPSISEETIHRYLEYGQMDKWGKRRACKVDLDRVAEDYFPAVCSIATQFFGSDIFDEVKESKQRELVIGLDIMGAGGGQWTLTANSTGEPAITRGLPPGQPPLIQLDMDEFIRMFSQSKTEQIDLFSGKIGNRIAFTVFAKALASQN